MEERRRTSTLTQLGGDASAMQEDEITHILSVCRWYEYQTRQANSRRCGWRPVSCLENAALSGCTSCFASCFLLPHIFPCATTWCRVAGNLLVGPLVSSVVGTTGDDERCRTPCESSRTQAQREGDSDQLVSFFLSLVPAHLSRSLAERLPPHLIHFPALPSSPTDANALKTNLFYDSASITKIVNL